jgi:uncharacterized protein
MGEEHSEIKVQHVPEKQRFEVRLENEVGILSYTERGDVVTFDHTYVPDAWRGRGVAAALVRAGVTEARTRGWKIRPLCSYVVTFFQRHPEFADVVR